ncbi:hypothetical protein BpHYR1_026566 [Brachionus plicatilis]|uniref:Uncharacterized protein n=1 Tax=Brachionus plicatilis TaxID=10195 RepID=A0A3M7R6Y2_BRAPC|nr:hypothetical protein BpHYR1_026566 [Brachionus plicatilis]
MIQEKKEEIVREQLHNGVGFSIYLDSKPLLYSSTSRVGRPVQNRTKFLKPNRFQIFRFNKKLIP